MDELKKAREEISKIDADLAELFCQRMNAVKKVAEYKAQHGMPILDPSREEEVVINGSKRVSDEELRSYYVNFIRETMKISRSYQSKLLEGMKVAYSGTEGAFAHIASKKLFPSSNAVPFHDFSAAYKSVEAGECDAAVLPLENSSNGEVGQVIDLLFSGTLFINSIYDLAVSHDLLVCKDAKWEDIKEVISHPQALGQCSEFINKHGYLTKEYSNTALAAKHVAEMGDKSIAAIASEETASIFGLKVLERNINASRSNTTRFAVLTRTENAAFAKKQGVYSVLLFTVKNEAGALAKAIDIIGLYGYNMRTIRSRPMKELMWQYYFYVEIEGDINTPNGKDMLKMLSRFCDKLKPVGTYLNEK
jgi:chorismate mutase/prephenate dehydratase